MRSLAFNETALGLRSENLASTAKPQHELVLIEWGCQGQSNDFVVQKDGQNSKIDHIQETKHLGLGAGQVDR
jgi:hypothetical protein